MEKSNELTQTHTEKTWHNNNDKKERTKENSTKERVKGNGIYIAEKLQETEQQKGHKQGQDEAQELTERE